MINSMARSLVTAKKWYRNISAGNPQYSDMELISTILVGSGGTASVTFTDNGAWSGYKHLQLRIATRNSSSSNNQDVILRFNNDSTSSNYAYHGLYGTGSGVGSESSTTVTGARISQTAANTFTSSVFTPAVADILDFSSSTKNKTIRTLSGHTGTVNRIFLASNLWAVTTAVSSIALLVSDGSSFVAGSRFSLYGIKG